MSSVIAAETVYKWTDENGAIVYSDKPNPNAKPVQLKPLQSLSWQPSAKTLPTAAQLNDLVAQEYTSLTITKPNAGDYVRSLDGSLEISVDVKPELKVGHAFKAYLDGQPVGSLRTSRQFTLSHVERGEHELSITIEDQEGKQYKTAGPIPFFLQRNIVPANRPEGAQPIVVP